MEVAEQPVRPRRHIKTLSLSTTSWNRTGFETIATPTAVSTEDGTYNAAGIFAFQQRPSSRSSLRLSVCSSNGSRPSLDEGSFDWRAGSDARLASVHPQSHQPLTDAYHALEGRQQNGQMTKSQKRLSLRSEGSPSPSPTCARVEYSRACPSPYSNSGQHSMDGPMDDLKPGRNSPSYSKRHSLGSLRQANRSSISYAPSPTSSQYLTQYDVTPSPLSATIMQHNLSSSSSNSHHSTYYSDGGEGASSCTSPTLSATTLALGQTCAPIESNTHLLSIIAAKERKCLDLREELKRHESDLTNLKNQWESIVAGQLTSTQSSTPSPKAALHLTEPRSEITSPKSISNITPTSPTSQASITDIQSAKKWMGGLVKSSFGNFSGILEGITAPPSTIPEAPLHTVQEETEDEAEGDRASVGTDLDDHASLRRISNTSSNTTASTAPTSLHSDSEADCPAFPPASPKMGHLPPRPSSAQSLSRPPQKRQLVRTSLAEHNRRKSAFPIDFGISAAAFSLSKRWGEVSASETIASSRRAAMSFVDTFEKTLSDAILIPPAGGASAGGPNSRTQHKPVHGHARPVKPKQLQVTSTPLTESGEAASYRGGHEVREPLTPTLTNGRSPQNQQSTSATPDVRVVQSRPKTSKRTAATPSCEPLIPMSSTPSDDLWSTW